MPRKNKIGNPTGVSEWDNLETVADYRRLFRWLICSVRDQSMDPKTAAIMAQVGSYAVKTFDSEVNSRLDAIEHAIERHLRIKVK